MLKSPVIINSWGVVAANDRKELKCVKSDCKNSAWKIPVVIYIVE